MDLGRARRRERRRRALRRVAVGVDISLSVAALPPRRIVPGWWRIAVGPAGQLPLDPRPQQVRHRHDRVERPEHQDPLPELDRKHGGQERPDHPRELELHLVADEHPTEGLYRVVRQPVSFSAVPFRIRRHAPRLGEHTGQVLAEVGFSEAEIVRLTTPTP